MTVFRVFTSSTATKSRHNACAPHEEPKTYLDYRGKIDLNDKIAEFRALIWNDEIVTDIVEDSRRRDDLKKR